MPSEAGVYPIRVGVAEDYTCDAGLTYPLGDVQIGVLVVDP